MNGDGIADAAIRLMEGEWRPENPEGRKMLDPCLIADPDMRVRFLELIWRIGQ